MKRATFAKAALVGAAGLAALAAAGGASAQSYGQSYGGQPYGAYGYNSYDGCQREANGRGLGGAFVGGALGATVGSQMAARGHRTDGSVLGGVLGALVGAGVGSSSAACRSAAPPPPSSSYYGNGYSQYGYAQPAPDYYAEPSVRYGSRYDRDADEDYAYGRRGQRLRIAEGQRVDRDGCTLAESPIYMPDGRTQTRFVRVCRDSSGRYAVVD